MWWILVGILGGYITASYGLSYCTWENLERLLQRSAHSPEALFENRVDELEANVQQYILAKEFEAWDEEFRLATGKEVDPPKRGPVVGSYGLELQNAAQAQPSQQALQHMALQQASFQQQMDQRAGLSNQQLGAFDPYGDACSQARGGLLGALGAGLTTRDQEALIRLFRGGKL